MKRALIVMLTSILSFCASAQMSVTSKDSSVVSNIYAGYLGINDFTELKIKDRWIQSEYKWSSSVRIAGNAKWNISEKVYLNSFGVVELQDSIASFGVAYVNYATTKNLSIQVGNVLSSLATNFRPLQYSSSGQFEFISQSLLTRNALGLKVIYDVDVMRLEATLVDVDNLPEYQLVFGHKLSNISFGGFKSDEKIGGLVQYKKDANRYALFLVYKDKTHESLDCGCPYPHPLESGKMNYSTSLYWQFNKSKRMSVFYDIHLTSTTTDSAINWIEVGLNKGFELSSYLNAQFIVSTVYSETQGHKLRTAFMVTL